MDSISVTHVAMVNTKLSGIAIDVLGSTFGWLGSG